MTNIEAPRRTERERIPKDFFGKVERLQARGNYLCVGLDNSPSMVPSEYKILGEEEGTFRFNRDIIDATADLVCSYKPNVAFYEESIEGERALERTIEYIHEKYPDIPVLADNKLGDIGPTSEAYARKIFGRYKFDAVTVSPNLGQEALRPLLNYKDKGIIAVVKTSNPGGGEFQDLPIAISDFTDDVEEQIALMRISGGSKIPLYLAEMYRVSKNWNKEGNCAVVAGATYPDQAEKMRAIDPDMQFLIPGIGSQGGDLQKAVAASMSRNRGGMIINSSSGISFAKREQLPDKTFESVGQAARREALKIHDGINFYRENPEGFSASEALLARELNKVGVIKFSEEGFRLKLHETQPNAPLSPIYIDQRVLRSASNEVKLLTSNVFNDLMQGLKYDAYADTPTAITPMVSLLSYLNGIPMITPRGEKTHGSGASIDGDYTPGQTVAVDFDDVITSGASAEESILKLRAAGVIVRDFVALVNREQGGIEKIKSLGVTPHWAYDISNLLRFYKRTGIIDTAMYNRTVNYFKNA